MDDDDDQVAYHQKKSLDKVPAFRNSFRANDLRLARFNFIKFWCLIYNSVGLPPRACQKHFFSSFFTADFDKCHFDYGTVRTHT
jgi:hypothetical protein